MNEKNILKLIQSGQGITHPSTFHADDIFSTALLQVINPKIQISRTSEIPEYFSGIVYDIGLGEYDHHQANGLKRENGIKYAAFGLIWKDVWHLFMDEDQAKLFDACFISEIDRCDNGPDSNLLSTSLEMFNPIWNIDENSDDQFFEAVELAKTMLKSLISHFSSSSFVPKYCKNIDSDIIIALKNIELKYHQKDIHVNHFETPCDVWKKISIDMTPDVDVNFFIRTFLNQCNKGYGKFRTSPFILACSYLKRKDRINILERFIDRRIKSMKAIAPAKEYCNKVFKESNQKDIIIFDTYVPYDSLIENHDSVRAVSFPTDRNGWAMICVSKGGKKRLEIPEDLYGEKEEILRKKYHGLSFVHPSGHMAVCDTKKDIINFYKKIAKNESNLA